MIMPILLCLPFALSILAACKAASFNSEREKLIFTQIVTLATACLLGYLIGMIAAKIMNEFYLLQP